MVVNDLGEDVSGAVAEQVQSSNLPSRSSIFYVLEGSSLELPFELYFSIPEGSSMNFPSGLYFLCS